MSEERKAYMVMLQYGYHNGQAHIWEGIILDTTEAEAIAEGRRHLGIQIEVDPRGGYQRIWNKHHDFKTGMDDYIEWAKPLEEALRINVFFPGADLPVRKDHEAFVQAAAIINGIKKETP